MNEQDAVTEMPDPTTAAHGDLLLAFRAIGPENSMFGGMLRCALAGIYAERADRLVEIAYLNRQLELVRSAFRGGPHPGPECHGAVYDAFDEHDRLVLARKATP